MDTNASDKLTAISADDNSLVRVKIIRGDIQKIAEQVRKLEQERNRYYDGLARICALVCNERFEEIYNVLYWTIVDDPTCSKSASSHVEAMRIIVEHGEKLMNTPMTH